MPVVLLWTVLVSIMHSMGWGIGILMGDFNIRMCGVFTLTKWIRLLLRGFVRAPPLQECISETLRQQTCKEGKEIDKRGPT